MGEFEMALVWFIRGQRVPLAELDQLQQFKHGEEQCRTAIEKAIEAFDAPKLRLIIDRKKILGEKLHMYHQEKPLLKKATITSKTSDRDRDRDRTPPTSYYSHQPMNRQPLKSHRAPLTGTNLLVSQNLLEELFDDYAFLRDLETSPSIRNARDPILDSHITGALDYLEGRIEFWRARNPKAAPDTTTVQSMLKSGKQITRTAKYLKDSRVLEFGRQLQVLPRIGDS